MPQTITRKCQEVYDYIQNHQDDSTYRERSFTHNTQVEINSNGDWKIWLRNTPILAYDRATNTYQVKNGGWRSRTTSHDIRAYLMLFFDWNFMNWDIFVNGRSLPCEDYEVGYGHGRKRTFNPTNLILNNA